MSRWFHRPTWVTCRGVLPCARPLLPHNTNRPAPRILSQEEANSPAEKSCDDAGTDVEDDDGAAAAPVLPAALAALDFSTLPAAPEITRPSSSRCGPSDYPPE